MKIHTKNLFTVSFTSKYYLFENSHATNNLGNISLKNMEIVIHTMKSHQYHMSLESSMLQINGNCKAP